MLTVQEIRELIKVVDESAIDEFTYETSGETVTMKKSGSKAVAAVPDNGAHTDHPVDPVKNSQPNIQVEQTEVSSSDEKPIVETTADFDHEIVSPMVGTFYASPNPESDSYVTVGSKVEKDTVVCIVEAMKLFNEIEAETTGEITEILVEDGELVEYGQPLFRVKKK
ncbi:acetyl-CoA carboxylase biotin carboxyl carrier protein [Lentibacillus cibarius]|uniref:Biotin carboxyl carrier protein of acetyl-CoA carboxylase n=1 Tax=Lentibacillus cibarius TaxID=2583219 RepID=A0A549YLC6_9BACI|nr:acetyl-CoA carboxylase biotin carboxyl carrier protein [Lentibacillus cibarius]TMN20776.1 acetyl-CoA carboxylase biotin carboxyl carrier protein [Lentibacillus cibarius]TRM12674.1 acetyl-CoA carboxylase biotin carboxyl carrier protein [Lentibacillus cibarius]